MSTNAGAFRSCRGGSDHDRAALDLSVRIELLLQLGETDSSERSNGRAVHTHDRLKLPDLSGVEGSGLKNGIVADRKEKFCVERA